VGLVVGLVVESDLHLLEAFVPLRLDVVDVAVVLYLVALSSVALAIWRTPASSWHTRRVDVGGAHDDEPVDLQRRVRQHDNDMSSTYELIFAIQNTLRRHGNRMAELTEMVAAHDARFDTVETKLDTVLDVVRGLGRRDT